MRDTRFVAALPSEVATEAIRDGKAATLPRARVLGDVANIAVGGLGVTASIVTLAQTPATIAYLAERLRRWSANRNPQDAAVLSVEAEGPGGRLTLELTSVTSTAEIARLLKQIAPRAQP